MRFARTGEWSGRLSAALLIVTVLAGCGSFKGDIDFGPRIGFRPDAPSFAVQEPPPTPVPLCSSTSGMRKT